jgi:hypothetical protein
MNIDMDMVAIAAVIVAVMLVSMRLLYGYWPWQDYRRRSSAYKRGYAAGACDVAYAKETSEARINASDFPYTDPPVARDTSDDHFERPATGGEPVITTPPMGTNRTEETT